MEKLKEDSRAVSQVRAIVKREEEIMTQETQVVHEYAEVNQQFRLPHLAAGGMTIR